MHDANLLRAVAAGACRKTTTMLVLDAAMRVGSNGEHWTKEDYNAYGKCCIRGTIRRIRRNERIGSVMKRARVLAAMISDWITADSIQR